MSLPDVIAPGLRVLFCGINPGLQAAASGHHFVGRGNRFWPVMHLAGFTPHLIAPQDSGRLLRHGYGLTTLIERATAGEDGLAPAEYRAAAAGFRQKIRHYAPAFIGFLGKAAYAGLVGQRDVAWGPQDIMIEGCKVWLLPNPSGRNRSFSLERLVAAYQDFRVAATEA